MNKKEFVYQPAAKGGTQSFGYHGHKSACLFLSDAPLVTKLTRRLFDMINLFNEAYWRFEMFADFDRPQATMGRLFGHGEAGYLLNQYGPGDKLDCHVDYMPEHAVVSARKLAFVMQMTRPDLYVGGDLKLRSGDQKLNFYRGAGAAVLFPSFIQHEVSFVREGVRRTMTSFLFDAEGRRFQ